MKPTKNLTEAIRASLIAKRERMLHRPLIAEIQGISEEDSEEEQRGENDHESFAESFERMLREGALRFAPANGGRKKAWIVDPSDGTCSVPVLIDYEECWRGYEKEVHDTVSGCLESHVVFLTEEQKDLLERSPREFLELQPKPETAELISFESENIGGSRRVVELTVAAGPDSTTCIRHVAFIPNLVQIERQLEGLHVIESAPDDGPLGPLRALVGLCEASCLEEQRPPPRKESCAPFPDVELDGFQLECIRKAEESPHFTLIHGPPGSGKTTVIGAILQSVQARGGRALVVSPTHVAVDNVVQKLVPESPCQSDDLLAGSTLPVRYASRLSKVSPNAAPYWVGAKRQHRAATIAVRLENRLRTALPIAKPLFDLEDKEARGEAPLTKALSAVESVICGTPIGILSHKSVQESPPAAFDLLIVDEVSKMTLPEFLAIAVKTRRWVFVGDPEQLPPFNNVEENATTLDDIIDPLLELACSVGAILERVPPHIRCDERVVVVSSNPGQALKAIKAHLGSVMPGNHPSIALCGGKAAGIIVCEPESMGVAGRLASPPGRRPRPGINRLSSSVRLLIERGIPLPGMEARNGMCLVTERDRAQALIFEKAFNVYHAQPWSIRAGQKLPVVGFRNGIVKHLPSVAARKALGSSSPINGSALNDQFVDVTGDIAERIAVNTVSVYDWLAGMPTEYFDTSPLREFAPLASEPLRAAVSPFVGTLKKTYRLHPSLSRVPRELFYFGEALQDGRADDQLCKVHLLQVDSDPSGNESNPAEVKAIVAMLGSLGTGGSPLPAERPTVMIITPYKRQEALLSSAIEELRSEGNTEHFEVEACTLDRCQGREADYVFISLVKSRATPFLDMPKRWNVALTRAMKGLFIVGNVEAYLAEAMDARMRCRVNQTHDGKQIRPQMSLLARIIEAYYRQIDGSKVTAGRPRAERIAG